MNKELLTKRFGEIGARLCIRSAENMIYWRRSRFFSIDLINQAKGETFDICIADENLDFSVIDTDPKGRHLLLMVSGSSLDDRVKFLCGHDERHWFVAGVFPNVSSVEEAKNILKPQEVLDSEIRNHVKRKSRLSRRNAGFVRQGEWFFVPVSDFHPDEWLILHKEPIQRGQGKPHIVEYLYRYGGTTVYVSQEHPTGLTESSYRHLVQKYPEKKNIQWRIMKRDPKAYAKSL